MKMIMNSRACLELSIDNYLFTQKDWKLNEKNCPNVYVHSKILEIEREKQY
jgi:hypothetical protein